MSALVVGDTVLLTRLHSDQKESYFVRTFKRAEPAALGTVQIMLGLVFLMLGIIYALERGFSTGIHWASLSYVFAGSLAVAAGKSESRPLMKACLFMNAVAAACAFFTLLVLFSFGTLLLAFDDKPQLVVVFLVILHVLEFCVAVSMAVFASQASCDCLRPRDEVFVVSAAPAEAPEPAEAPPTAEAPPSDVEAQPIIGERDEPSLPPSYSELTERLNSTDLMTS